MSGIQVGKNICLVLRSNAVVVGCIKAVNNQTQTLTLENVYKNRRKLKVKQIEIQAADVVDISPSTLLENDSSESDTTITTTTIDDEDESSLEVAENANAGNGYKNNNNRNFYSSMIEANGNGSSDGECFNYMTKVRQHQQQTPNNQKHRKLKKKTLKSTQNNISSKSPYQERSNRYTNVSLQESLAEDFDFQSNLDLFNKKKVFAEIEETHGLDPKVLLVTHNRRTSQFQQHIEAYNELDSKMPEKFKHNENILEAGSHEIDRFKSMGLDYNHYKTDFGVVVPHLPVEDMANIYSVAFDCGLNENIIIENAARSVSQMTLKLLGGARRISVDNTHQMPIVCIFINGDTLVGATGVAAGRQLASHNVRVILATTVPQEECDKTTLEQIKLYSLTGAEYVGSDVDELPSQYSMPVDLIIDGLFGESNSNLYQWAIQSTANILSLDIPAGVRGSNNSNSSSNDNLIQDSSSSKWVLAYGLPKHECKCMKASSLYLADIGIPREIYKECNLDYFPPFGDKYIVSVEYVKVLK